MAYTPQDIVSVFPGTYTPGAETALTNAVEVINAAWNQANIKEDVFETKIDNITNETTGWLSTTAAPHITGLATAVTPTIIEPPVDIPASADVTDVMSLFDTKYLELVLLLSTKFTDFRTTYFNTEGAVYSNVESWLQGAMTNPTGGMPIAVQNQLLTEDKDRITAEATRASDSAVAVFAARRFPLPPGALAGVVTQHQQKAQDDIAASSRKITLGSIDMMKFAVEKTLSLRQIAMGAAIDYIKALASGPEMASHLVNVGYDAQSKLIGAAASFYNARTDSARLISSVDQFNVTASLTTKEKNQMADLTMIEDKLKALLTECQALAQMATSLFNNVHASAGTGYSVSVT